MKRLVSLFLICCLVLCGCNTSPSVEDPKSQSGVSDGTISFESGNIRFTIPSMQQYILTESHSDLTSVTICDFNFGDANLIVSVIDCRTYTENEISERLVYWNNSNEDKFSNLTYDSSTELSVMGENILFSIFVDYSSNSPVSHYISTFTDSHYIYLMEIILRSNSSSVLDSVREMITSSEYIGPQKLFENSQ